MTEHKIKGIYRYPVKSMQGQQIETAMLTPRGIPLDRGWAVKNERTGNIQGAKRFAGLMQCTAQYLDGTDAGLVPHVAITFPDGTVMNSDDDAINARLSDFLGAAVSLWPLQPTQDTEHYKRRDGSSDPGEDLRVQMGLGPDDPMPDFSGMSPEIMKELGEFAAPLGTYFDAYPMCVLTTASMRKLSEMLPDAKIGVERFRPNILIDDDAGISAFTEFDWVGKGIEIGEARLSIDAQAPRCSMVTHPLPGYDKEMPIIKTLMKETAQNLAVYATVTKAGQVRRGDKLKLC